MSKKREKRSEKLYRIRLTPSEKSALLLEYKDAFQPTFAEFIRHKLLSKEISVAHQRKFEAYIKIGNLRQELNAIGVNVNQIAKRMNTYDEAGIISNDRKMLAKLRERLELINTILDGIS